jgi:ribosomal protein S13
MQRVRKSNFWVPSKHRLVEKQLTDIKGIGRATAKAIKASAIELLGGGEDASDEQGFDSVDEEAQEGA